MSIFQAIEVTKQYANHKALDEVSLEVPEGKVFGLLGPNGAGKTTLIRIINQITAPDSGQVLLKGKPLKPDDIHNIGYLPEERGLYKKMKVGEQAIYLAQLKGMTKSDAIKKLKIWFDKFEITPWWDKKVEELSKGMQQKVQFIVTILHEPELLIFDEPFSGFDPINTNLLKNEILKLKEKGCTIIFSTHNMESVEEVCDHIALLNNSKKILDGPVDVIKNQFKSNLIECTYKGDYDFIEKQVSTQASIISHKQNHETHHIKASLKDETTGNDLIKSIISHAELISFNEIVPRMNDIFIKAVEKANQQ